MNLPEDMDDPDGLDSSDLDRDNRTITVREEISKTTRNEPSHINSHWPIHSSVSGLNEVEKVPGLANITIPLPG